MYDLLLAGVENILHLKYLLPLFLGTLAGLIGGALPGVTITMTIIIVLPFTFGLDPLQGLATMTAMTSNFFLNNWLTYRDRRLKGWNLLRGLVSFYIVCSVGAVGNVGVANYVFHADQSLWLAGVIGAVVGAVWNYATSAVFTWRSKTK